MGFDAGALIFTIKAAGKQVFKQDMREVEEAQQKAGRSAETAAKQEEQLGKSTDAVSTKAKAVKAPLDDQAKSTEKVGEESRKAKPKQEDQAKAAERQAEAAKKLSVVLLAGGVAMAAFVGLSVAKFADFDQAMSNVTAATMATREEQDLLADAALDAGADTAYSAREAADAEEELAKAGQTTAEIVGGSLNGALALAAAGQLAVARSAEIMATTLKVYRLPAEQAAHVSDLLAAAAGKAQGSVDDAALALDYAGIGLAQFNVPLEESVGTLALFAANGILGEKAGTGLRGALAALTGPSAVGARTMKEYGVNVFDAQGAFIGMAGVAGQLQTAFSHLTEEERSAAMNRIFGNESMNVANTLYREGSEGVQEWTEAVDDSGYAAEQAAIRQDNLAGDIEKLGGAFDTALIKTGSGANQVLRDQTQTITALIDWYGELDPSVQAVALTLGIGVTAMLLFSGATLGAIGRFAELKKALEATNLTMGKTTAIAAGVGLGLTAVIAVVGLLATAQAEARAKAQAYSDTLEEGTNRITAATRDMIKTNLAAKGSFLGFEGKSAFDAAEQLGVGLDLVTDAAMGDVDALKQLQVELDAAEAAYRKAHPASDLAADAARDVRDAVKGESASIEEATRVAEQKQSVDKDTVESTDETADAYEAAADEVDGLVTSLADLIAEIDAANGVNLSARDAARQLEAAYDDFDAALEKNGLTLDRNTEEGRANEAALDDIAQAAMDSAEAIVNAGGGYDEYRASLEGSRQSLLDRIGLLGITGDEAAALADEILRIPTEAQWNLRADTADAEAQLKRIQDLIIGIGATSSVHVSNGMGGGGITQADGGKVEFYGNGGRSESHVAQFARAGDWRVWAEPETGGEWYIPASPAKRGRSTQILAQAAAEFGYQLMPSGGQSFGDGGRAGAAASAVAPDWAGLTVVMQLNGAGMDEDAFARVAVNALEQKVKQVKR